MGGGGDTQKKLRKTFLLPTQKPKLVVAKKKVVLVDVSADEMIILCTVASLPLPSPAYCVVDSFVFIPPRRRRSRSRWLTEANFE